MAYTKVNHLLRIIDVQEAYKQAKELKEDITVTDIYEYHIRQRFRISRSTFYNYLSTNARKQLRELDPRQLEEADKNQLKMF